MVKKKAFTLVELVLALAVMSVGLISLLLVLRNAYMSNAASQFITMANELAEARLDEIVADCKRYGFGYVDKDKYPDEDPVRGFPNCKREVEIYYVELGNLGAATGSSAYKKVVVAVKNRVEPERDVRLATILSDY